MEKKHYVLCAINILLILGFGGRFLIQLNYEFVIYVAVIIFFLILISLTFHRVKYRFDSLVGLTIWSAMHLAGGGIEWGDGRIYDCMLIPLSDKYPIFRYDQMVHIFGFGVATLVMFDVIRPLLKDPQASSVGLGVVLVMAGLGAGAFNEVVEFIVNAIVPESGVGGYVNTSLDLCSNFIGALIALVYIRWRATLEHEPNIP